VPHGSASLTTSFSTPLATQCLVDAETGYPTYQDLLKIGARLRRKWCLFDMAIFAARPISFCLLVCLSGCNRFHFRPNNVPRSAVWVDGTFIECSVETRAKADHCTVYKDDSGEILADGLFLLKTSHAAADKSELQYAAFGNGSIYLSDARKLVPWVPSDRDPTRRIINERLSAIAARGREEVTDCDGADGKPHAAADCALRAFGDGKPFYAKYFFQGVDSFRFTGFAGDADGNVYEVDYDSAGWMSRDLPKEAQLLDGKHTFVMPCPKPIYLVKTEAGKLACSRPIPHHKHSLPR
jgi:hypothetical protein